MLNKSENYELALSTTTLIPQGIFNITEVNLLGKSFSSKLPRILKPNSTYASIKPMNSEVLAIEQPRPKSSWNSFLKRNFSRQSSVSTAMLEDIKQRVKKQVDEDLEEASKFANPIMKTIQRLENSEYVKSEVLVFKKSVLEKKNSYNKIHHENLVKEETLEQLEQQLEMLVSQCDNYSGQQNSLKARDYECKALNRKLKEQLKDQEILENMIITKKTQFNSMAEPIKNKKKIIETLSTLIEKHSRDIKKESGQIIQSTKELERANKYLNKLHEEKEQKIEIKIKTFADKKKFRYCMKKEKEKNQTLETHTNKAKDLLDLEFRLTKLKEDELLSEEIKNIEAHCLREEQKFLAIQKVTNIVSVSEMYPHFMYLIENQERLKGCVESTLRKIEDLSRIREELSKDLEELKLKTLNNQQYNKEIQAMEDKFKLRALFIDNYEEYVEKIENVVVTSINSISRLVYQLDLVNEVGELDSENLMECFKRCRNKLDILIDFIKKNDFEAIESINTDINFKRSPNFLKLNTKPLNKNPLQ